MEPGDLIARILVEAFKVLFAKLIAQLFDKRPRK